MPWPKSPKGWAVTNASLALPDKLLGRCLLSLCIVLRGAFQKTGVKSAAWPRIMLGAQ